MSGANHEAELVSLDRPRPLSNEERQLLEALVERSGLAALSEQTGRASVVAQCSCGCPSIGLETDAPAASAAEIENLSDLGRGDWLGIQAIGNNAEGREVEVTLHVTGGRLSELEVWAATHGGSPATTLPAIESLHPIPPTGDSS